MRPLWDRRTFLKSAGATFLLGITPARAERLIKSDLIFASAYMTSGGDFAAALVSETGEVIATIGLPGRGHDVVQCPISRRLVAFARRPGTFALVFSPEGEGLTTIASPAGRHFYGHGVFSPDGKLLYATENDFEAARGVVGIYDATDDFRRLGEMDSHGTGPHDVLVSPDGRWLIVANGGIETHPDYGRAKLNLSTMQPNLAFIDRDNGTLGAHHDLPPELHQLSMRHLAVGRGGSVWIGGQYQGPESDRVPLLARAGPDTPLSFAELPDEVTARLSNYIGSVAATPDGERVAITSPVGNLAVELDAGGNVLALRDLENVCGAVGTGQGFSLSTGNGVLQPASAPEPRQTGIFFDNHLVALR